VPLPASRLPKTIMLAIDDEKMLAIRPGVELVLRGAGRAR
jgi:hypothetical protein